MRLYGPEQAHARVEVVSYGIAMTSHYSRAKFPTTGALMVLVEGVSETQIEQLKQAGSPTHVVTNWQDKEIMTRLTAPSGATVILGCSNKVENSYG